MESLNNYESVTNRGYEPTGGDVEFRSQNDLPDEVALPGRRRMLDGSVHTQAGTTGERSPPALLLFVAAWLCCSVLFHPRPLLRTSWTRLAICHL